MRRLALTLVGLLTLAVTGSAAAATHGARPARHRQHPAHATTHAVVCAHAQPIALTFTRADGQSYGVLAWKAGWGAPRGSRYRVVRNTEVVGQTRRTSMRVNVFLGRRYRFRVRLVLPTGASSRCVGQVSASTAYRLPSTPQWPAASDATGPTVTISWQPSVRGDGAIAGYRLMRNGAVFGQTKVTSLSVPISSNATYSFTVVAVDSNGRVSAPSVPVTVQTGHTSPPAPTGLEGGAINDSTIDLSWQPSVPARGPIGGYRVLRNGVPVGEYSATSVQLTGLTASTTYTFTVVAVDSLGYVSGASAPVTVATADPVQTTGHAFAFVLSSVDQSFQDFQAHYTEIGTVSPTYYDCDPNGNMTGADVPLITSWAQARGERVLPRFNCQRTAVLDEIVNDPTLAQQWITNIVNQVTTNGYDGATLDFEAGLASDRNAYTAFVTNLASALHAAGKLLMLCVSPKAADVLNNPRSTFFDYNALSAQVDYMFVMGWGIHWATSAPGAQDDMTWESQVVHYISTLPRVNKYILGMQLYAMDWANGGGVGNPANSYQYSQAVSLAASLGITPTYNPSADAMTFTYTDSSGAPHSVWFTDAATEADRISLAQQNGLGGVGFWRMGEEDQNLWSDPLLTGAW